MSLTSRITRLEQAGRAGEVDIVIRWHKEVDSTSWNPCRDPRHGPRCQLDSEGEHVIMLFWEPPMPNLRSRLAALERKRLPSVMRGSLEVHYVGGTPDSASEPCQEHESCTVRSMPLPGVIRRVYVLDWKGKDGWLE